MSGAIGTLNLSGGSTLNNFGMVNTLNASGRSTVNNRCGGTIGTVNIGSNSTLYLNMSGGSIGSIGVGNSNLVINKTGGTIGDIRSSSGIDSLMHAVWYNNYAPGASILAISANPDTAIYLANNALGASGATKNTADILAYSYPTLTFRGENPFTYIISGIDEAKMILDHFLNPVGNIGAFDTRIPYVEAIEWWAKNGGHTSVKQFAPGNLGENYNRYDVQILGFTNYWNHTLNANLNPNDIKAIMYKESLVGYYNGTATANGTKDVMQVLDPRNPAIYRLAAVGNFDPNEGTIPRNGYMLFSSLFDDAGNYNRGGVYPEMSIAGGTRWFIHKGYDFGRYNAHPDLEIRAAYVSSIQRISQQMQ